MTIWMSVLTPVGSAAHVPELPSFVTFIKREFSDQKWATLMSYWENILFSCIIAALIVIVFSYGIRKREMLPSGLQNFLEWVFEGLQTLIYGVLGENGPKFFPLLASLFVYILSMNYFGLVPLMKAPSSNINIAAGLAIVVFAVVQYQSIRNMGVGGYMYHLAGSPKDTVGWLVVPLMFPLELLTQFARPVTLSLRLFGNIFGEHILLGAFALFGVTLIIAYDPPPVGVPLQIPFLFLSLLTGMMQALVFTLLSSVYILLSFPSHDENH